jgi:hypothetical protein
MARLKRLIKTSALLFGGYLVVSTAYLVEEMRFGVSSNSFCETKIDVQNFRLCVNRGRHYGAKSYESIELSLGTPWVGGLYRSVSDKKIVSACGGHLTYILKEGDKGEVTVTQSEPNLISLRIDFKSWNIQIPERFQEKREGSCWLE